MGNVVKSGHGIHFIDNLGESRLIVGLGESTVGFNSDLVLKSSV